MKNLIYIDIHNHTVISSQNMDYSTPEEIQERVSKVIGDGLETSKTF